MGRKVFPGTEIIFIPYEHNFLAERENFLFTLYKKLIYITAENWTEQHWFDLSKRFLGMQPR